MYPLPRTPGENEPTSPERYPDIEEGQINGIIWIVRGIAVAYLASISYWLWKDEIVKAHLLHLLTKFCQSLARHIGGWGINMENSYNSLVMTWH